VPKVLTYCGLVVAGLMLLLFGLDLAVKIPFSRASLTVDILFLVTAAILAYMSWATLREQT
jgi:hypothetical protein